MNEILGTTKNIVHLAKVLKMKMIVINKYSSKLKNCSVKMPNAPYSNRQTINKPKNLTKFRM